MSRKPANKKSVTKALNSEMKTSQKKSKARQWNLPPFKKWMNDISEKVVVNYALPLTRITESKLRELKIKLEHVSQAAH